MEEHGIQIAVLDRGFVYIGEAKTCADWLYLTKSRNIRVWGTDEGLGQLINGPRSKTVLDYSGKLKIRRGALIVLMDVNQEVWAPILNKPGLVYPHNPNPNTFIISAGSE